MSRHSSTKTEREVASGALPATSSVGAPVQGQTPSARSEGGNVEIARLAYSDWEARGCTGGSAEEDWFRAEQEVKAQQL